MTIEKTARYTLRGSDQTRAAFESAKKNMGGVNKAAAALKSQVVGLLAGGGVALAFKSAIGQSVRFEDSLTKIVTLVGENRAQVAQWRTEILAMAPAVRRGPEELAEGLFFVTGAGITGAAAMDTLRASAMAAAAGLGETNQIADAVTSALNAYGQENLTAADATGILVAAVREGKVEADAIAGSIGRALPLASELGITFDQVGASVAAMSRLGLNASESISALRGIMTKMIKPTKQGEETLKQYGLSMADIRRQVKEEGLFAALMSLKAAFGENQTAMSKVFEDVEGLVGVMNLVGENAENNRQIFEELAKSGAADLQESFEGSMDSGQKLAAAAAAISAKMIVLGDQLLNYIAPAALWAANHIDMITSSLVAAAKIAATGGAFYVAFLATTAVIGMVNRSLDLMIKNLVGTAFGLTTATAANDRWTLSLTKSAAATAANVKKVGMVKSAFGVLFAAVAGWQIGTWLREEFVEARIAGLAFVGVVLKGWENLKFGFQAMIVLIRGGWDSMVHALGEAFAKFLRGVGEMISNIPGFDEASEKIIGFANSIGKSAAPTVSVAEKMRALTEEFRKNKAAIDENIVSMIRWEMENENSTKASVPPELSSTPVPAATPVATPTAGMSAEESAAIEARLATLKTALGDESLAIQLEFEHRLVTLRESLNADLITKQEFATLETQLEANKQMALTEAAKKGMTEREKFQSMTMGMQVKTVFGALESMTAGVANSNKTMFKLNKIAGIANAVINTATGVTQALAAYPPPISFIMAAAQLAAGVAQIQSIKSATFGGGTTPSKAGSTPTYNGQPVGQSGGVTGTSADGTVTDGGAREEERESRRTIIVQGIDDDDFISGGGVRRLIDKINSEVRNGAHVIVRGR